ncbi:tetratricopeptide repeat protein [Deefgea tanakiae]|uniref:Ancillary SecYEG translocon subunit n=1 Tax=Deefgea tanakiae TaxID=2865840 RepID=A0ABX8Z1H5_9NEIS|nr:tetratricopeptide repeat protein [Deefgea tanakiae]QZA76413.1 tetratricopeptide repeat protein [Deefgea tanakiae]
MAAFDLQEQEQIATLKAWWQSWGKWLALSVAAFLIGFAAWAGWQKYQKTQIVKAAEVYAQIEANLAEDGKFKAGVALLKSDYTKTPYAPRAAMIAAKLQYLKGDAAAARTELQWVIDHSTEAALRDSARLRMASILLEDKKFTEALALMKTPEEEGFSPLYAEQRGDIYVAKGEPVAAADAYRQAIAKLPKDAPNLKLVEIKLDVLGGK